MKVYDSLLSHYPNTPCLRPNFCISIVFKFSWEDCKSREKLETMLMQNIWGGGGGGVGVKVNKVQGVLWECESSEYQFLNKFLASKASFNL